MHEECSWPEDKTGQPSNDPNDPGGYTIFGLDQRSHPTLNLHMMDYGNAVMVYFNEWEQEGCETMPSNIGEVFFNCCVNCGFSEAKQLLARSSPGTAGDFLDYQESFYTHLVAAKPNLAQYLSDWLGRTKRLRQFLQV